VRPQAHTAAGLAGWSLARGPVWEAPLAMLCGNLPDLDRSVARALGVERRDHHRWVSHSAAGWALPTLIALRAARRSPHRRVVRRGVAAVWIHLLMDSYADGIAWRWPLSEDKVGLFRKPAGIVDRGWSTPAPADTNLGRIELGLWALVALGLARR
jgi:hypothetical protein